MVQTSAILLGCSKQTLNLFASPSLVCDHDGCARGSERKQGEDESTGLCVDALMSQVWLVPFLWLKLVLERVESCGLSENPNTSTYKT